MHPVFNPVAPYRYLLPTVYLFMADIENTDLYVVVGPGFVSTLSAFMRTSASHPAGPHGRPAQNKVNQVLIAGGGMFQHNCSLSKPL